MCPDDLVWLVTLYLYMTYLFTKNGTFIKWRARIGAPETEPSGNRIPEERKRISRGNIHVSINYT